MKRIKRKLNNNDGVTILIALVGFMVAAMISIVIVTAAITSAQRVANDKKTNQAHLTLESAAQIIRDGMEETTYVYKKDSSGNIVISSDPASGMFAPEMKTAVSFIEGNSGSYSSHDSTTKSDFTISVKNNTVIKQVDVSYIMKNKDGSDDGPKYDLYFTLGINGTKQNLYLTMDGKCEKINDAANGNYYLITWKTKSINEIGEN